VLKTQIKRWNQSFTVEISDRCKENQRIVAYLDTKKQITNRSILTKKPVKSIFAKKTKRKHIEKVRNNEARYIKSGKTIAIFDSLKRKNRKRVIYIGSSH